MSHPSLAVISHWARTYLGYAGDQTGGSLSILAPLVRIGGSRTNSDTLVLQPDFFSRGGFSTFALTGFGAAAGDTGQYIPGIVISPGTVLAPAVQSWVGEPDSNPITLTPAVLSEALRSPLSLSFSAPGVRDVFSGDLLSRGDVVAGSGSSVCDRGQGQRIIERRHRHRVGLNHCSWRQHHDHRRE